MPPGQDEKNKTQPKRSHLTTLNQICNLIPPHLAPKLARETGVEKHWRGFSPWSHSVTMLYGQVAHSVSLNDLCDSLQLHCGPLSAIRGATPPSRNNLSHANRVRDAKFAEQLFWQTYAHWEQSCPGFSGGRQAGRFIRRFRTAIHLVDSSVIELVASCLPWAKHRRRKAAAKLHLKLELQSFLPNFAIIDTAGESDAKRARELCAGILRGEIAIFDKAYVDFDHLGDLHQRGVWWVTRAKENMAFDVIRKLPRSHPKVLKDEIIMLCHRSTKAPELMRRVVALVEIDGEERPMTFLTNNLEWSPWTVAELYPCRAGTSVSARIRVENMGQHPKLWRPIFPEIHKLTFSDQPSLPSGERPKTALFANYGIIVNIFGWIQFSGVIWMVR
ncbi:MAG: IS4 family transposase [Verrucomicrobia bacterium]|nr:IS4 family transposase [Verrucomicrobiota bacterium]